MILKCWFCTTGRKTKVGLLEHMEGLHGDALSKAIVARKIPANWVVWLANRELKSTGTLKISQ